jgi:tRNA1(Val) A37 N6-methylase TrmN6
MAYLGIPQNTIAVLQKYHFNFQKKFGQNFLIDTTVLDRIISSAEITKEDCVLEIGPGIGTMTQYLAERAGSVVAVEIDKALLPILEETLQDYDNVTVINDDILKVDINRLVEEKNIIPEFFDLKTRIAGDILQKFTQYQMPLTIVGDFSKFNSKSLNDFIYESNKGKQINFVTSQSEAIKILSDK